MKAPDDIDLIQDFLDRTRDVGGGIDSARGLPISHQTLHRWRRGLLPRQLRKPTRAAIEAFLAGRPVVEQDSFEGGLTFAIERLEGFVTSLKGELELYRCRKDGPES